MFNLVAYSIVTLILALAKFPSVEMAVHSYSPLFSAMAAKITRTDLISETGTETTFSGAASPSSNGSPWTYTCWEILKNFFIVSSMQRYRGFKKPLGSIPVHPYLNIQTIEWPAEAASIVVGIAQNWLVCSYSCHNASRGTQVHSIWNLCKDSKFKTITHWNSYNHTVLYLGFGL